MLVSKNIGLQCWCPETQVAGHLSGDGQQKQGDGEEAGELEEEEAEGQEEEEVDWVD